jgi:hypothetical protein
MGIQKQQFYEGAALHQLIRGTAGRMSIVHSSPFFTINDRLTVHLKYCTAKRSPWSFTFTPLEQLDLLRAASQSDLIIGLICGADGVSALPFADYAKIAQHRETSLRISCKRLYRKHFEVTGPDAILPRKIAPSEWVNLLANMEAIA